MDGVEQAPRFSGLTLILVATVISGVASYFVTWLVPRQVGFASYAVFAVFWSFIYLLVGTLSGIQQEVTRATRSRESESPRSAARASVFAASFAIAVASLVLMTAPAWVESVFPERGWELVWPLAFGAACYVLVAVLGGSLSGIAQWVPLALMMMADALLRLIAISLVLTVTTDVAVLAWAVALPFPAAIIVLWPFIRRRVVMRTTLDVSYRYLIRNVGQTMLAAAATAVMVSGFPLALGLASAGQPKDVVGLYILVITLTRAPLIVVVMSLQSYLVVTFRDRESAASGILRVLSLIFAAGAVLAVVGYFVGSTVFVFLFPGEPVPEGWFIAVLVFSSALVASLCVTGPAVLARSRHLVYGLGWLVAAVVTIVMLALPLDFTLRTVLALVVGPTAGLIVHGGALIAARDPS